MVRPKVKPYLLASIVYMAILFYLSSARVDVHMGGFSPFDKLVHLIAYGLFAALIYLLLQQMGFGSRRALVLAFLLSFVYGGLNEVYQYFLPWRDADVLDAAANGIGAFSFPLCLWLRGRRHAE